MRKALLTLALLVLATPAVAQSLFGDRVIYGTTGVRDSAGSGSPESAVVAGPGSIYHRTDTGSLCVKTTGTSNTGWVCVSGFTNIAYTNVSNVFTASQSVSGTEPIFGLTETDGSTNNKNWRWEVNGEIFRLQAVNDAGSSATDLLAVTRAGAWVFASSIQATIGTFTTSMSSPLGTFTTSVSSPAVLSTSYVSISSTGPIIYMTETDGSTDNKNWRWIANGEVLSLQTVNDAVSSASTWMTLDRAGTVTFTDFVSTTGAVFNLVSTGILGTSPFVSQTTGWRIAVDGSADFRYLFTSQLQAQVFTADSESILAGTQAITKSYGTISQTFTCPSAGSTATLWVKDNSTFGNSAVFVTGDAVVIHDMTRSAFGPFTISDCVGTVSSYADGTGGNAGQQSWTFTRGSGGNAGGMAATTNVAVDVLAVDYGTTGNGIIYATALDGSAGVNSPYTDIRTWATSPVVGNFTTRCRFGQEKGITGVSEYGLLCGTYGATNGSFIRATDTNFDLHGITQKWWDGSLLVAELAPNSGSPFFGLGNGTIPTSCCTTAGIFLGWDHSATKAKASFYSDSTHYIQWDGSKVMMKADNFELDSSGYITASGAIFTNANVTLGTPGSYTASNALKFVRPTADSFGQTGDVFGMYSLDAGTTQVMALSNDIVGTTISGTSTVSMGATGWRGTPYGVSANPAAIRFQSVGATGITNVLASADQFNFIGYGTNAGVTIGAMPSTYASGTISAIVASTGATDKLAGFFAMRSDQNQSGGPQALEGYTYMSQTGTTTLGIGTIGNVEHGGSGTITQMRGVQGGVQMSSTGGGDNAAAFYAGMAGRISGGSGTYAYGIGLEVSDFGAGFTNKYSIYSHDSTAALYNAGGIYTAADLHADGGLASAGVYGREGSSGGSFGQLINFYWTGSALQAWVSTTNIGDVTIASDERLKQNVTPLTAGLSELMKLQPVQFQWKEDVAGSNTKTQYGLLAQQVSVVMPTLTSHLVGLASAEAPDGPWRVDYMGMVPVLIKAIQEQDAKITALQAAVKKLGG